MKTKLIFYFLFSVILISIVLAFTPQNDINLRSEYAIINATNISSDDYYYSNGTKFSSGSSVDWDAVPYINVLGDFNLSNGSIWNVLPGRNLNFRVFNTSGYNFSMFLRSDEKDLRLRDVDLNMNHNIIDKVGRMRVNTSTGDHSGIWFEPSGWPLKHRVGAVGASGGMLVMSSNYNTQADTLDYESYGTASIELSANLKSISLKTGDTNETPTTALSIDANQQVTFSGNISMNGNYINDIGVLNFTDYNIGVRKSGALSDQIGLYGYDRVNLRLLKDLSNTSIEERYFILDWLSENKSRLLLGGIGANTLDLVVNIDDLFVEQDNGYVGIGTATPDENLVIYNIDRPTMYLGNGTTSSGSVLKLRMDTASDRSVIDSYNFDSGGIPLYLNPNDGLVWVGDDLQVDGNVGIGTDSPSSALDVVGDTEISGDVIIGSPATSNTFEFTIADNAPDLVFEETDAGSNEKLWMWRADSDTLALSTCQDSLGFCYQGLTFSRSGTDLTSVAFADNNLSVGTDILFIDSDTDRVGIGNITPSSALEVSGNVTLGSNDCINWLGGGSICGT